MLYKYSLEDVTRGNRLSIEISMIKSTSFDSGVVIVKFRFGLVDLKTKVCLRSPEHLTTQPSTPPTASSPPTASRR
jgi:hypothetical protein